MHQRVPVDVEDQGEVSYKVLQLKINIDLHFAQDQEVCDPEGQPITHGPEKSFFFSSLQASGEAPKDATGAGWTAARYSSHYADQIKQEQERPLTVCLEVAEMCAPGRMRSLSCYLDQPDCYILQVSSAKLPLLTTSNTALLASCTVVNSNP